MVRGSGDSHVWVRGVVNVICGSGSSEGHVWIRGVVNIMYGSREW